MRDLLPEACQPIRGIPKLIRDVVESGGRGIKNRRGFYSYSEDEAKRWEDRFREFNYKMRRLSAEYSELLGSDPPVQEDQAPASGA